MPKRKKRRKSSKKKKKASGAGLAALELRPSAGLAALLRCRAITRGDAVKQLWAYARGHGLNDGRSIRCDGPMRRLFGVDTMSMYEVPKLLSAQLTSAGGGGASGGRAAAAAGPEERAAKRARRQAASAPAPAPAAAAAPAPAPRPTGPVVCSGLLTAVLCGGRAPTAAIGQRQLTLPGVSSVHGRLLAYIASHKLRIPRSDSVVMDDMLRSLAGSRLKDEGHLPLSELYNVLIGPHIVPVPASRGNLVAGTTGDVVAGTTGNVAAAAEASPSPELERGERGGGESGDRESFELVLDESPDAAATQIAGGGSEAPPSEDGEGGAGAGTQLQPMGPTGRRRRTLSSDEEDDVEDGDEDESEGEEQAASASEAEESEEQEEVRAEGAQEGAAAAAAPGYSTGAQRLGGGPCASEKELRQRRLQALEPSDAEAAEAAEEPEGPEAPATEPQHEPASSTDAGAAAAAAPTAAPSVCEWLRSAGLGDHVAAFEAEKIDMLSLGMLTEADLTALGLPLGHRRRFQAYVEAGFG